MLVQQDNLELMKTMTHGILRNGETYKKRHAKNADTFWPGQPDPTKGLKGASR